MNKEDSTNKKERMGILNEVLEYGDNIISQVPAFRKFSVACMDHIGEKSLPYIKSAYEAIRYLVPKYISDNMDSPEYVNSTSLNLKINDHAIYSTINKLFILRFGSPLPERNAVKMYVVNKSLKLVYG
ncbi:MAG: hypothetical protein K2N35_06890 [Muribaculaceae bacterium]|nr:hypothetical protein [Muribaculaceae bacterium]